MADKNKKTMDVAKPGESAPDTSSRPVIVSHRPIVQDPMMKGDEKDEKIEEDQPLTDGARSQEHEVSSHTSKVIQPPAGSAEADKKSSKEASKAKPEPEPEPEDDKQEDTKKQPEVSESAGVDAVADQADITDEKKDGELSEEEKTKQVALQKLITNKKYFVKIGQISRRRNRRALIILIVLLLIVVGGYLAVDAGLIKTSIKLPFDLIKN